MHDYLPILAIIGALVAGALSPGVHDSTFTKKARANLCTGPGTTP